MKHLLPKYQIILLLSLLWFNAINAQNTNAPIGGGNGLIAENGSCLTKEQRQEIIQYLKKNTAELQNKGLLSKTQTTNNGAKDPSVRFIIPLKQNSGFSDPGFYGISNYLDEDFSTQNILDFNCGTRTYDGHKGTDFFTWPFPWSKMDNDQVKVVAAAAETIIGKQDFYYDKNCSFCTSCQWNAVYVQNNDGSICWYGHMKTGSLTTKLIGETVAAGEYLGNVGSSGSSTGPHLHLEIYNDNTYSQLVDPWGGQCNYLTSTSIWANQEPYYIPSINKIATHNDVPAFSQCYGGEQENFCDTFYPGSGFYFAVYLRDQQPSSSGTVTITRPNGSTYIKFINTFNVNYSASYWYWYQTLPTNAPIGKWRFSFQYNGQIENHDFIVTSRLPLTLIHFSAINENNTTRLKWQSTNEINTSHFIIQHSTDGENFKNIGTQKAIGNGANNYGFADKNSVKGINYYRLKCIDKDGSNSYSKVVTMQLLIGNSQISISPNPARDFSTITFNNIVGKATIEVFDITGKAVLNQSIVGSNSYKLNTQLLKSGVYVIKINTATGSLNEKLFINK